MYAKLITGDADDSSIFTLALQRAGLTVTSARNLDVAIESWSENPADIILSAIFEPCPHIQVRRIRTVTLVPLILLVKHLDPYDQYDLLKLGADLVIDPCFNTRLLVAQIGVLLRRSGSIPAFALPTLDVPGLTLDPANRSVRVSGSPEKRLTHLEFRLLYALMMHRNQVVETDTIVQSVWGFTGQGDRDLVRGLVNRLRRKIEDDSQAPRYISTVSGIGYRFNEDDG